MTSITDDSVIAFNDDPTTREFTYHFDQNLDLCGADNTVYSILVTGTVNNVVADQVSASASYTLTLKNPCIDNLFLSILPEPLPIGTQYILHDYDPSTKFSFAHSPFTI